MFGLSWLNLSWEVIVGIIVVVLILLSIPKKHKPPKIVRNVRYDGYEKHTETIINDGRDAKISYNEITGSISFSPGSAPSVKEIITGYSVYFIDSFGKDYVMDVAPEKDNWKLPDCIPNCKEGTIGTLIYEGNRFKFNKYDNQTKAKREFNTEYKKNEELSEANRQKAIKEAEDRRNRPSMKVLRSIWFFLSHILPTILIANLAIIMPQFCTWTSTLDLQVETNPIVFGLTIILEIIVILVSALLLYAFYFGHILIVPFVSLSCFKKDYPILKRFLIVLLGLVISYATGNMIEPKLIELGMVMESHPFIYWGTMTNTVILCGMATNLLALVFGLFSRICSKNYDEYEKYFDEK